MNKKVLLVRPHRPIPQITSYCISPPINLGYIAAYLEKNGIEVRIVDEFARQNFKKALKEFKPEIVGITVMTYLAPEAYRAAKIAKEAGCLTVMGGVHASAMPYEALEHVDIVVIGEGEKAMLEIVNGREDKIIRVDYINDLDELPPLSWHLMNMEFFINQKGSIRRSESSFPGFRISEYSGARGCPYSCIFCYNSGRQAPLRFHSAERVVSDLQFLVDKYRLQGFVFYDDNMLFPKERFMKICQLIKKNKINIIWACAARVNSVDLESLQMAKEAGCKQIGFGFESGSQRILDILKKGTTTLEQNVQAIKLCKKVGILVAGNILVGNPTETIADLEATYKFVKSNSIDKLNVHITTPLPGTELWEWCKINNLIPQRIDWSKYTFYEESVAPCDTIPKRMIKIYAHKIGFCKHPLSFKEVVNLVCMRPSLIFTVLKNPIKAFDYFRNIKIFRKRQGLLSTIFKG